VYKYLYVLSGSADLSEDLTQETFYQAVKSYKEFRGDCKVSVWLCQIAKHLWYKEAKRRNLYKPEPLEEIMDTLASGEETETEMLEREEKKILYERIEKLEEKTREVMQLRLSGDLSFREIGEILGRTENWARVTFYRGKQKIMEVETNEK
jgi:RNA polymerase sigma-70 factor (ECF subfamily)